MRQSTEQEVPKSSSRCLAIRKREWPDGLPTGKAIITGGETCELST